MAPRNAHHLLSLFFCEFLFLIISYVIVSLISLLSNLRYSLHNESSTIMKSFYKLFQMENVSSEFIVNTTVSSNGIVPHFLWYDYVLTLAILAVSSGLGIYFGCCGKRQSTAKEYLLAGKQMKVIPVTISLILR